MLRQLVRLSNSLSRSDLGYGQRRLLTSSSVRSQPFFSKKETASTGYSSLLSDDTCLYELVVEDVKPKHWDAFLQYKGSHFDLLKSRAGFRRELVASWRFIYGDVNFRAMHLFQYPQGWSDVDATRLAMNSDEEFLREQSAGYAFIARQESEFMKSFSYWPHPTARSGNNIYDVRSYTLHPGSMYDWANYWAKGIKCRTRVRTDIPYGGFFTQLGRLHTIYHIWCYTDLADRKSCRETTWSNEGWNDVVSNTVPLVRNMSTKILEPLPFSPTK